MFKNNQKVYLDFQKVCFGYKPEKTILSNISFSIMKNQHVCIIGSNGSGKSTLVKIIAGLFKPTSGSITFNDQQINKKTIINFKKSVGIIFENPDDQLIGPSVQDDIAFSLENRCVPHSKMQSIINNIATYVGINNLLTTAIKNLSGGQKQLVALASVLALNPEIIIFDEATSMLDSRSKKAINKIIHNLKLKNKTVISITHNMDEAAEADRIIVMFNGMIVMDGTPSEIFNDKRLLSFSLDKPFSYKLAQRIDDEK